MLWEGCLGSSESSLKVCPGHRLGFLSTSVQPIFHRLSLCEFFQPFPRTLPITQSAEVQLQPESRWEPAFRTFWALQVLKKLYSWGWSLLPHPSATWHVTRLVWAPVPGEDGELGMSMGDEFLPIAESRPCLTPMPEHTHISHGATFLHSPWSSFCSSLLRMWLLVTLTAGDLWMLYTGSPGT